MKPPEEWHGGWVVATWAAAALALLALLQAAGYQGSHPAAAPRSHGPAFVLSAVSLVAAAVPFWITWRWLGARGGDVRPGGERAGPREEGDEPE